MSNIDLNDVLANLAKSQSTLEEFRMENINFKSCKFANKHLQQILQANTHLEIISFKNSELLSNQISVVLKESSQLEKGVSLDFSGIQLSDECNKALQMISKDPGFIKDIKLDGTNLEPGESEKICKLIEKSVLKINTKKQIGLQESSIMASRFSVVWNSVQKERYKPLRYLVEYSTHHLYADFPKVKAICFCKRSSALENSYVCTDCSEIRCDNCSETSCSLFFCSKCGKINESGISMMTPRTCLNCIECPKCETQLKVDKGKIDKLVEYFFYSCPYCHWNSIRNDVSTKKSKELFNTAQNQMNKLLENRKKDMVNLLNIHNIDFLFKQNYFQKEVRF